MARSKSKPLKPSRPLLEVLPSLHAELKVLAAQKGMPLKELSDAILSNGVLRVKAGVLLIEKTTRTEEVSAS